MLDCKNRTPEDRLFEYFTEMDGWCSPEFSSGCLLEEDDE